MAGLLLQLALAWGTAHARAAAPHTELKPPRQAGATLAPPAKRHPDVMRPERLLRLPIVRHAATLRLAPADHHANAVRVLATAPPRARSHAQRLRVRPPDDPLQPTASA